MVELGKRSGNCKNSQRRFFVKGYFTRGHLTRYNLAVKLQRRAKRGNQQLKYSMNGNTEDVAMSNHILNKDCERLRPVYCWSLEMVVYCFSLGRAKAATIMSHLVRVSPLRPRTMRWYSSRSMLSWMSR